MTTIVIDVRDEAWERFAAEFEHRIGYGGLVHLVEKGNDHILCDPALIALERPAAASTAMACPECFDREKALLRKYAAQAAKKYQGGLFDETY